MSTPTFRTIPALLETRLEAQADWLKTCRQFHGTLDALLAGAAGAFETPAIFILFDEMIPLPPPEGESFDDRLFQAKFTAACISRSLGGRAAAAESSERSAHEIVELVLQSGADYGFGIAGYPGLTPGAVRAVKADPTQAVYSVELFGAVEMEYGG